MRAPTYLEMNHEERAAHAAILREVGYSRLADVAPERVRWLWPSYLPAGKIVLLDGDPALGKSTIWADLAGRLSTGSPLPDGYRPERPATTVVLSAEDGLADTIRPRVDAAGGDPTRIYAMLDVSTADENGKATTRPPTLPADIVRLETLVRQVGAELVVVDVLMAYLSDGVNAHRDQDVRRALHALSAMADRCGCCVLLLRHLNKAGGVNALYRGGGSIGIIGAARAGLLVAPDPEDDTRRLFAVAKSNLAAIPDTLAYRLVPADEHGCARISWEGPTAHRAADLLGDSEERTARVDAVEFVQDLLADGPVRATAVYAQARQAGVSERTLKRAKEPAGAVSYKEGFGADGVWYWKLVEGQPDPIEGQECQQNGSALFAPLGESVAPNGSAP